MIKVWMICEVLEGSISKTAGAEKEGIIEAAWYTKAQLAGEVVFPPPLIQHDWDQLRSENWQVECLPTRKADFLREQHPTNQLSRRRGDSGFT